MAGVVAPPTQSLNQKVVSAVIWTGAQSWGVQALGFVIFLILARLLEPSAFGLIALASVYVHVSSIFVDQGLATAIVQRKSVEPEHLDAAFWISVSVGMLLMCIGIAASGYIAALFREPLLAPVVSLLSANFVFTSLNGVQAGILRREFKFRFLAIRSLIGTAVGGAAGIWMAFAGYGVMALVGHQLVTGVIGVALLWSVGNWRPRLSFSPRHARDLMPFSGNVLGIRLLHVANKRTDDLLIGYFLGSVALGYYAVAYKIFRVLLDMLAKVFTKVAVPAFASIQSEQERVRNAFYRGLSFIAFAGFPVFAILSLMAPDVITVFFGAQWSPSAPVMRVLAVLGVIQILYKLAHQVLIAVGRPGWTFVMLAVSTVLSVIGFAFAARHGIVAVAFVFAGVGYVIIPFKVYVLRRFVGFEVRAFLHACRGPLLGTLITVSAAGVVRHLLLGTAPGWGVVAGTLAIACPVYLAAVRVIQPELLAEIRTRARNPNTRRGKRAAMTRPADGQTTKISGVTR